MIIFLPQKNLKTFIWIHLNFIFQFFCEKEFKDSER